MASRAAKLKKQLYLLGRDRHRLDRVALRLIEVRVVKQALLEVIERKFGREASKADARTGPGTKELQRLLDLVGRFGKREYLLDRFVNRKERDLTKRLDSLRARPGTR